MNFIYNFFKTKNKLLIKSPISGKIISLKKVPDLVFSKKIVGNGIAIKPNSNKVVSPINGKIIKIFETLHAFSIESKIENIQMFIHVGIDTVKMKGKGFQCHVKENQEVKIGDLILTINLKLIKKKAKSTITPIIISNPENFSKIEKQSGYVKSGKDTIMNLIT